jgi:hypothetical protein
MKEFKKNFFETLIQLTILVNVFRQGVKEQHYDKSLNDHLLVEKFLSKFPTSLPSLVTPASELPIDPFSIVLSNKSTDFLLDDSIYIETNIDNKKGVIPIEQPINKKFKYESLKVKDDSETIKDIKNILKRSIAGIIDQQNRTREYIVWPATFLTNPNNIKDTFENSDRRLLLENNNQFKEDYDMDYEMQTIPEQDLNWNKMYYQKYSKHNFDFNPNNHLQENQKVNYLNNRMIELKCKPVFLNQKLEHGHFDSE